MRGFEYTLSGEEKGEEDKIETQDTRGVGRIEKRKVEKRKIVQGRDRERKIDCRGARN